MKLNILILSILSGFITCGCTYLDIPSVPSSCELFWSDYMSRVIYLPDDDSTYFVTGDWADKSVEDPYRTNFQLAFYKNASCFVGLTPDSVIKLLGVPSYILEASQFVPDDRYVYMYIRQAKEPNIPVRLREGEIVVHSEGDTISDVSLSSNRSIIIR